MLREFTNGRQVYKVFYFTLLNYREFVVIRDQLDPAETLVSTLRSKVSIKTGLPVSVFRLCTASGKEMFDVHTLEKYGVRLGDTLQLHVWDGWSSLLVAATQGHTKKVLRNASSDEQVNCSQRCI